MPEDANMKTVKARTGKVAYVEQGSGVALVLLHANPGDHRDFEAIIPALASQYRVIAVDFPGYGESTAPNSPQSASAMLFADVLDDVVEALGLEQAVIVGNSVGGYAATRLAITHPQRVQALILVSTGGFTAYNWRSRLFCQFKGSEWITRLIATQFARAYLKSRNEFTAQILERTEAGRHNPTTVTVDAAVWRSFLHPEHDLRQRATHITAPTLIISGRYDPVIQTKTDARITAASIPNSQLVVLDTGHMPFAEDPDAFLRAVQPILEKVKNQYVASHL
jgi:3-oxoadipate enol-lactonase